MHFRLSDSIPNIICLSLLEYVFFRHDDSVFRCYVFNPFPQTDACCRICSIRHCDNIVAKGEIATNDIFLNMPQCFELYYITSLPFIEIFHISAYIFLGRLRRTCCKWERVKSLDHNQMKLEWRDILHQ